MHIFIDESGSFVRNRENTNSVSSLGALIIPDRSMKGFDKLYRRLRSKLPKEKGEVKGRLLNEVQVTELCKILKTLGCIFEVISTDMKYNSDEDVAHHQAIQAEKITLNLTDEHQPQLVDDVTQLRTELEALAPQLYIQSVGLSQLLYNIIEKASLYFSLRWPKELGKYHWVIDAKGKSGPTNWENWWSKIVLSSLESKSARNPFNCADFGDFSAQDRFLVAPDDYKIEVFGLPKDGTYLDVRAMLMESFRFSPDPEFGLEAADILTNAIRRSMMGNFRKEGWMGIRELMIHNNSSHYIELFTLGADDQDVSDVPYANLLKDFSTGGKSMLRPVDYATANKKS